MTQISSIPPGGVSVRSPVAARPVCEPTPRHAPTRAAVATTPRCKRAAELLLVLAAGPLWVPLLGFLMLMVRLDSRGPAVFRQTRVGRGGTPFTLYKLRSMTVDADDRLGQHLDACEQRLAEWRQTAKLKRDPRLTRLGRWLRRSSLDELPQLINVLRGDMSLVGPRPVRDAERVHYGAVFDGYEQVRPGLSGLWQVSGRNDLSYPQRVALDRRYLATRSWRNELKIWFRTVGAVLSQRGAY